VARRYPDAISSFGRIAAPDHFHHASLAACFAQTGDATAAHRHVGEVLKRDPTFSVETYLMTLHYSRAEDREHHRDALVKSGLPMRNASAAKPQVAIEELGQE
jgi:hypothetical protein